MQNICKNEASPADEITSQNMNKLWWKIFAIFPMIIENLCLRNQYLLLSMNSQSSGQNNDWKRLCPPLQLNFISACSKKQGKAVMLVYLDDMFILLGNYLHTTVSCSRNIELNHPLPQKNPKLDFNISVQVQSIKLESKSMFL